MNGLNTLIEDLHDNLIKDINNSKLPVGIVYYVMKDVLNKVEKGYEDVLRAEEQNSVDINAQDSPQEEEIEDGHQE